MKCSTPLNVIIGFSEFEALKWRDAIGSVTRRKHGNA